MTLNFKFIRITFEICHSQNAGTTTLSRCPILCIISTVRFSAFFTFLVFELENLELHNARFTCTKWVFFNYELLFSCQVLLQKQFWNSSFDTCAQHQPVGSLTPSQRIWVPRLMHQKLDTLWNTFGFVGVLPPAKSGVWVFLDFCQSSLLQMFQGKTNRKEWRLTTSAVIFGMSQNLWAVRFETKSLGSFYCT